MPLKCRRVQLHEGHSWLIPQILLKSYCNKSFYIHLSSLDHFHVAMTGESMCMKWYLVGAMKLTVAIILYPKPD